jgi:hypothetical protein
MACPDPNRGPTPGNADGALRRCHHGDRLRRQDAHTVEASAAEHHLREAGKVCGGSEEPGVPDDAAHSVGGGVVHGAGDRGTPPESGWGDAGSQAWRRTETGVVHPERPEDKARAIFVQLEAGGAPHQLAEDLEVDVAVDGARARLADGPLVRDLPEADSITGPVLAGVEVGAQS